MNRTSCVAIFIIITILPNIITAQTFKNVILTKEYTPETEDSCNTGIAVEVLCANERDHSLPSSEVTYNWLQRGQYRLENSLSRQVLVPDCYTRIPVEKGSFAEWLRFLPLDTLGKKIYFFNGLEKPYQDALHQILNIDIGIEDLQQCADAAMRLISEYHYSRAEYHKIYFNFTSGHRVSFDDWRKGRQAKVSGGRRVYFTPAADSVNNSYQNLKAYFNTIFTYAGSYSLSMELKKKPLAELTAGDMFVRGGFPGHVVLVVDVAVHEETGEKIFLLLQGGMPAQHVHIFKNFREPHLSPWYSLNFEECFYIPGYDFEMDMLYESRGQ